MNGEDRTSSSAKPHRPVIKRSTLFRLGNPAALFSFRRCLHTQATEHGKKKWVFRPRGRLCIWGFL